MSELWHDAAEADLRTLCATTQWSTRRIASELSERYGQFYSRNSILGKLHRLGLKSNPAPRVNPVKRPPRRRRVPGMAFNGTATYVEKPKPVPLTAAPEGFRCTLIELKPGDCRWPSDDLDAGDPGFDFCGAPVAEDGLSYCTFHWVKAHNPK